MADVSTVADICHKLDGLPLAIETGGLHAWSSSESGGWQRASMIVWGC